MEDQASTLRKLARYSFDRPAARIAGPAPTIVTLWSGKGGVGVTTLAVNLAAALARDGHPTVLVDGDCEGADATHLCRIDAATGTADVLNGRNQVHEALVAGPAGLLVLPGSWLPRAVVDDSSRAHERLLAQLRGLGAHARFAIVDAGAGRTARYLVRGADLVLTIATPDAIAVMDAYAAHKTLAAEGPMPPAAFVVNQAEDESASLDAQTRFEQACRRFLGASVAIAPCVPRSPEVVQAHAARRPFVVESPQCAAALAVEQIAAALVGLPGAKCFSSVTAIPHRAIQGVSMPG
jgi:flagellar biosynthesis protein FlhG